MRGPFQFTREAGYDGLELEHAGVLEGTVRLGPGEKPAGRIVGACNGWDFVRTAPVGDDGSYRIEDLAPGSYQVRPCRPPVAALQALGASGGAARSVAWDCEIRAGQTTHLDLDLTREGAFVVAGTLALEATNCRDWRAALLLPEAGDRLARASAELDPEGRFRLAVSSGGPYLLQLAGGDVFVTQEIELLLGETEWSFRPKSGSLRVHLAPTAAPGSHEVLRYVREEPGGPRFVASTWLQCEDGADWMTLVPAGRGRLERAASWLDEDADWTLVRELEVGPGQELVVELP